MYARLATAISLDKPFWIIMFIFIASLMAIRTLASGAQSQASLAGEAKDRVLEDAIPKSVPIKVNLKKEAEGSFRDLQNNEWPRDFELEVKNTGDKPIYFLNLELISNVTSAGVLIDNFNDHTTSRFVFSLYYGRAELGDIISKAAPNDVPIAPGEIYVFKIHRGQLGWGRSVREGNHPDATRIQILFQAISFGDGTGLWTASGTPYPPARSRQLHPELYPSPQPPD